MIKLAPLNPVVPRDVAELGATREKEMVAGKLHAFQGPVRDNSGKERVAAGKMAMPERWRARPPALYWLGFCDLAADPAGALVHLQLAHHGFLAK